MSKKTDRDIAKEIYLKSNGSIALVDIAEQLGKSPGTIRGWKSRYKWDAELKVTDNVTLQKKCNATKKNDKTSIQENKVEDKIIEEVVANSDLTDKQQLFCIYYLKYFNATKAYQKAYGCSYNTAMVEGHRSLRKPNVKAEIERLKAERLKGIYLDSKDILQKYIDIAFSDVTDYVNFGKRLVPVMSAFGPLKSEDGEPLMQEVNYVDFKESTDIDGTIVSEVAQGKNGVSLKLFDKMKALDWLSKNIPKINDIDLDKELLAAKVEKEVAQTKLIQMQLSELKGEDIDQDTIDNFIEATKPNETDIKSLFEDES